MSEDWKKWGIIALKILIVGVLSGAVGLMLFLLPHAIVLFLPFIIAFFVKCIAGPIFRLLRRAHLPKPLCAIISILLVIVVLGGVLTLIIMRIASEASALAQNFSGIYSTASAYLTGALVDFREWIRLLPDNAVSGINTFLTHALDQTGVLLNSAFSKLVTVFSTGAIGAARNVPSIMVAFIVTLLASYFMMSDSDAVVGFLKKVLGEKNYNRVNGVKGDLFAALGGYVRAQLILMSITFVELLVGFLAMRVEYAFLLALLIAVIDAIPILGTGTVLIPWALTQLIMRNYAFALGLLILYGVCLSVRQLLEPKIVSTQIGVHPLITLMSMYVGLRLFGFIGMILGPVIALIVKNLAARLKKERTEA